MRFGETTVYTPKLSEVKTMEVIRTAFLWLGKQLQNRDLIKEVNATTVVRREESRKVKQGDL